jgi:hypothetical protein
LSKHQQVQVVRIANVPDKEFEEAVERERPLTLTSWARNTKDQDLVAYL